MNKIIVLLLLTLSLSIMINGIQYSGFQTYIPQDFHSELNVYPFEKVSFTLLSDYNTLVNISINGHVYSMKRGEVLWINSSSKYNNLNIQTYTGLFLLEVSVHPNLLLKNLYEFSGSSVFLLLISYVIYRYSVERKTTNINQKL
jgi:hypothetical protein